MLAHQFALAHRDRAPVDEARPAADQLDLPFRQTAFVNAVQPQYKRVPLLPQRAPIESLAREAKSVLQGVIQSLRQIGGIPHKLLGNTAHVDAGTAEGPGLDERHARTVLGRAAGAGDAAATPADDYQIEFVTHGFPSTPP